MAFLEVNNIKKSFGKNEILKGISFDLQKGEVLSIIGSSGSGKQHFFAVLTFLNLPRRELLRLTEKLFITVKQIKSLKKKICERKGFILVWYSKILICFHNMMFCKILLLLRLCLKWELKMNLKLKQEKL